MKKIEYEFTLPDGVKRCEFVAPDKDMSAMQQINLCMKMHVACQLTPFKSACLIPTHPPSQRVFP